MKNIAITLAFIFCCIGCGSEEEFEVVYEGVSPHAVYILSVSEDRPAEVRIGWMYLAIDCEGAAGGSAQRNGNNIEVTIDVSDVRGAVCPEGARYIEREFTVKNLEVGEYIIKSGAREFGWLRIEPDTAYSFVDSGNPLFSTKTVTPNDEEHIGDTYHVTVSFRLPGWYNCEPIIKTNIEHTQDVINIEAWQVVPKTDCQIMLDPLTDQYKSKFIDIDLGTFSAGSYTVIINDIEDTFEVPPPFTN